MHKTSLLLCMLIYINYAGSEALNLLNQMQPKFQDEIESEDLIYKKATQQLKQQKPTLQIEDDEIKDDVSFREFYKTVRSNKHDFEDELDTPEPEPKDTVIQSYLQNLSDGLEPEPIADAELSTDPEKLGKFKKYFVKDDEPKTEVQDSSPPAPSAEKKLSLKEKLEMKKKQAQQVPTVAAIQIKQEEQKVTPEPNVGKTTLMKKIEEFKKLKQQKEQEEPKQEEPKEQAIPKESPPENPLRKLLNKKAEEKKMMDKENQTLSTQEVQIEVNEIEEGQDVEFEDQNGYASDEPQEIDLSANENDQEVQIAEHDESHQEYFVNQQDDSSNNIQKEDGIEIQKDVDEQEHTENTENLDQNTPIYHESEVPQTTSEPLPDNDESTNLETQQPEEQNQTVEKEVEELKEPQQDVEFHTDEPEIDAEPQTNEIEQGVEPQTEQNDQQQIEQIDSQQINQEPSVEDTEILNDNQEESTSNNQTDEQQNQLNSNEGNEQQSEEIVIQNSQEQYTEQNHSQVTEEMPQQSTEAINNDEQNNDQVEEAQETQEVKENNEDVVTDSSQIEQTQEIKEAQEIEDSTLNEGFVMENNVEVSDYLQEVEEAEKLRKKKEMENEILEEERLKKELEERKLQKEQKIHQLEQEEQQLMYEEKEQEEQLEQVEKQIEEEQQQFAKQFETADQGNSSEVNQSIQTNNESQQINNTEEQSQTTFVSHEQDELIVSSETNYDESSQQTFQEEPSNGFNIHEYEKQQRKEELEKVDDTQVYAQSSPLFSDKDQITQIVSDENEEIIEQSVPAQIEEIKVDLSSNELQFEPEVKLSTDILINGEQEEQSETQNEQEIVQNEQEVEQKIEESQTEYSSTDQQQNQTEDQFVVEDYKNSESQTQEVEQQIESEVEISDTPTMITAGQATSEKSSAQEATTNDDVEILEFDDYKSSTSEIQDVEQQKQEEPIQQNSQQESQQNSIEQPQDNNYNEQNILSVNRVHSFLQLEQDMKIEEQETVKIQHFELESKENLRSRSSHRKKKQQPVLIQTEEEIENDYNKQYFIELAKKQQQQELYEKEQKEKKLKARQEKQRRLEEEQKQQKLLQEKQQLEILKQQQQLIELQNQQLLNKQKYKMGNKQQQAQPAPAAPINQERQDNFQKLQKQQTQIQMINQQIDREFSFQQILSKVDREERQGSKKLRANQKHQKNADLNFFQLTEKQQSTKNTIQQQDLFEAIKSEMQECDVNNYTSRLCELCQSDVVYEINDDNWYLIGIAYGLKRHFQNLLNTVQYHFKNSKIYTSFNKEQQVCITLGDQIEIENLSEILNYYNNQTLDVKSNFIKIPQKIKANFAQMKVDLNNHHYNDFALTAKIKNLEQHNGFTITEQHIKVTHALNYTQIGNIQYPGIQVPYKLIHQQESEQFQIDLNAQIYEKVLQNYLSMNLLQKIQMGYRDNLNCIFNVIDNEESLEFEITIQK